MKKILASLVMALVALTFSASIIGCGGGDAKKEEKKDKDKKKDQGS